MMTYFSRWLMYISSYLIGYILIAISDLIGIVHSLSSSDIYKKATAIEKARMVFKEDWILFTILLILIISSLVWLMYFSTWKNNTRIHERMEKDSTIEAMSFLIPFLFSMVLVNIEFYGNLVNLTIFAILGFIFVSSGFIQTSPIFIILRYHVFKNSNCYVITRLSREAYNLKLEDSPDGLEVRELAKGIYIMFP